MAINLNLMRWWRSLFVALMCLMAVLGWRVLPNPQIDTDLSDVSPQSRYSPNTKQAIKALQKGIEQRLILLIQGDEEELVYAADEQLRAELQALTEIQVLADADTLAERLIKGLESYKFSLLTASQQESLAGGSAADIAQQARQNLFKTAGSGQLLPFDQDPLGWHSETFLKLLDASQGGVASTGALAGHALSIALKIDRGAMNMDTQERLTGQLDRILDRIETGFKVEVERSGVFFFAASAAKNAKQDVTRIGVGSIVGVVALMLFAFGSLRSLLLPIVSIVLGVGFAFVLTHSLYGAVHILTIVFGASLIGIVIDYSLHYFYHRSAPETAKKDGKDALHRALLFSLMTSLIGYAALSFSNLVALQKVAVFSCCGLLMAWLSVICLGQLATRKPISINQTLFPRLVADLGRLLNQLPSRAWLAAATAMVLSAALIIEFGTPFSDDPRAFFKPSAEILASERKVAALTNDYEPGRYFVVNGRSTAEIYARHAALLNALARSSQFDPNDLSSLLSWLPSPAQQHRNYQSQALLYGSGGAAQLLSEILPGSVASVNSARAEYRQAEGRILMPETVMQLFGDMLLPLWVTTTTQHSEPNIVTFVLIRKGVNTDALASEVSKLTGVEYINTLGRTSRALSEQRRSATALLGIAYLLIVLLVCLRYRAIAAVWLVAVPFCASAGVVVIFTLAGVALNLFHIMALYLVLGFGMDYTIFTREMSSQSWQLRSLTQQAILLSALTSLLSFGLLSISSIPVVSSFGLTLLVGNLLNLMGTFIAAQMLPLEKNSR